MKLTPNKISYFKEGVGIDFGSFYIIEYWSPHSWDFEWWSTFFYDAEGFIHRDDGKPAILYHVGEKVFYDHGVRIRSEG